VLQDIVGTNQEELEKQGFRVGTARRGFGAMTDMQKAKKVRRAADKGVRIAEIENDAAKLTAEAKELARRSKKLSGNAEEGALGDAVVPFIVGGAAAAAGTGYYMKNKNDKKINEIAQYYEGASQNK